MKDDHEYVNEVDNDANEDDNDANDGAYPFYKPDQQSLPWVVHLKWAAPPLNFTSGPQLLFDQ